MPWPNDIVLLTRSGSYAYGLATPTSDVDLRGVALPPVQWILGFPPRDVHGSETFHSLAGDDLVIHTLQKFCRLACKGNPNMLDMLFCEETDVVKQSWVGRELRAHRAWFLSKEAFTAHAEYANAQLHRIGTHKAHRGAARTPAALDYKNLYHLIRVLMNGIDIVRDGALHVKRPEADLAVLRDIRAARWTIERIVARADDLLAEGKQYLAGSPLPDRVNREEVEVWMMGIHRAWIDPSQSPSMIVSQNP